MTTITNSVSAPGEDSAGRDRLLYLLKTRGALSVQELARILDLTSMGARRQLEAAAERGLVHSLEKNHEKPLASSADKTPIKPAGKGRPGHWWALTEAGHARFPDRHGDIVVQLIGHLREQMGEAGVEQLISARETRMASSYAAVLAESNTLADKLTALAQLRTQEGYMAELRVVPDGWELIEHHCPICAAARQCQAFCRSELTLFRQLLPELQIERGEHLLNAGARCVYQMRKPEIL